MKSVKEDRFSDCVINGCGNIEFIDCNTLMAIERVVRPHIFYFPYLLFMMLDHIFPERVASRRRHYPRGPSKTRGFPCRCSPTRGSTRVKTDKKDIPLGNFGNVESRRLRRHREKTET